MREIKWQHQAHLQDMSSSLYELQQANLFCDTEFEIVDGTVSLHSLILYANMCGCTNLADLQTYKQSFINKCCNFSMNIVKVLVKYLYTGEVFLKKEYLKEFLKLCEILDLKDVISALRSESSDDRNILTDITESSILNFSGDSLSKNNPHSVVPVALISNRNNKTLEDTLMEENANYRIEIKQEPLETETSLFVLPKTSNHVPDILELSSNDSHTIMTIEKDTLSNIDIFESYPSEENSNVTDTVIKTENTEMDIDQHKVTSDPEKHPSKKSGHKMDNSFDISAAEETFVVQHGCDQSNYTTTDKSIMYDRHKKYTQNRMESLQMTRTCDQCGKSYKSKYGLKLHIKNKHEQSYKYMCSICDKGFNQKIQYNIHCNQHYKINLENCKFCQKSFTCPGSLKRHLESCTALDASKIASKSFRCDLCGDSFARKYSLAYHIKGKHELPQYTCNTCNKRFSWRSSLSAHKVASPNCS